MIGEKFLREPKNKFDASKIMADLDLYPCESENERIHNAKRIVELNNTIYERLNNIDWLKQQIFSLEHPNIKQEFYEEYKRIKNKGTL